MHELHTVIPWDHRSFRALSQHSSTISGSRPVERRSTASSQPRDFPA
jgi:hypothetical protein